MKKPALKLKPNNYALAKLRANFAEGVPLSGEQLNFLYRHQRTLSTHGLDPILGYYVAMKSNTNSFLLPHDKLTQEDANHLYLRLIALLEKDDHIKFVITPVQFEQLKKYSVSEMIFYHGNMYLTGAPFVPGGQPHVIHFQWGNLFGVVKYAIVPEELAIKGNLMIEVENRFERHLDECVANYINQHTLKATPNNQSMAKFDNRQQLSDVNKSSNLKYEYITSQLVPGINKQNDIIHSLNNVEPVAVKYTTYQTPRLTLSKGDKSEDENK